MFFGKAYSTAWRALDWIAVCCALAMIASPAQARPFHLWSIQEVYTNSSGTLQFIELVDTSGGQNFVGGQQISVSNAGNTLTNTFTIPSSDTLPGNTLDHMLLFGTAGLHAAGGPTPDLIIPNGFLFSAGGTINFFGQNPGPYSALPIDGTTARIWNGANTPNFETNFNGQSGSVSPVPEPSTLVLMPLAIGLGGIYRRISRRRNSRVSEVSA